MRLEPGDVVLVPFPFTDLTAAKTRPALVLSSGAYNAKGRDVIVCGITSNLANTAHSVLVESSDLASGRLPVTSRVKVDKVATLQQAIVRKRVGTVKPALLGQVLKEFRALFPEAG
jgi:mRNA interferase MazF